MDFKSWMQLQVSTGQVELVGRDFGNDCLELRKLFSVEDCLPPHGANNNIFVIIHSGSFRFPGTQPQGRMCFVNGYNH